MWKKFFQLALVAAIFAQTCRCQSSDGFKTWNKFAKQDARARDEFHYGEFPDDFKWGASTAAYQIEGAWDRDGKGESIWDRFTHNASCRALHGENGDDACKSYDMFDKDLELIKELGLDTYRFSIAWSRIFPTGRKESGPIPEAVDYYNYVIDSLIANDVTPLITLYHWDLPQMLMDDFNGFLDEEIQEHFVDYAEFCFQTFGDRVRHWFTFNEPYVHCTLGYGVASAAPGLLRPRDGPYICGHNMILCHAKAHKRYHELYPDRQVSVNGSVPEGVSITFNTNYYEPRDPYNQTDYEAALRHITASLGWFAHPIFVNGDYPQLMKDQVASHSNESDPAIFPRLPEFTEEEKQLINGSADFFCVQTYTTRFSGPIEFFEDFGFFFADPDAQPYCDERWEQAPGSTWLYAVPWGLRRLLNLIKDEYGNPDVWITENGFEDNPVEEDFRRINYFKSHLNEVLKAINLDGVKVRGYSAWSLIDNFEWASGYDPKFGIYYVDLLDDERTRYKKRSADWYRELIAANSFTQSEEEKFYNGFFDKSFVWGVETSAYQVEGAWDADGKGESIWDDFTRRATVSGKEGADSYNKMMEDIYILKELRVHKYSFTISWSRVLPNGDMSSINEVGIKYYNDLIDALWEAGIEPIVTLYHWDMPLALQNKYGGWKDDQIIADFTAYAELCFERFGDRVKLWMTLRAPITEAVNGYDTGIFPPQEMGAGETAYIAVHNMILAHASVWNLYNDEFRPTQQGKITVSLSSDYGQAYDTNRKTDVDAAERFMQWSLGWFMEPLVSGDYPKVMREMIAEKSADQGFSESRLPTFTAEQMESIKGTVDFVAISHYNTWYIAQSDIYGNGTAPSVGILCPNETAPIVEPAPPSVEGDGDYAKFYDWTWQKTGNDDVRVVPWGIRRLLKWIKFFFHNTSMTNTFSTCFCQVLRLDVAENRKR